jgi:hypothetical protein
VAEKLKIELIVDDKGSVVVKEFGKTADDSLKKSARSAEGATKKVQGLNVSWQKLVATAAAGKITYELFDLGKAAISAASDAEEMASKFNVVFAGQQAQAEAWATTLQASYAMSTRESKQYLASVQDLLVPMGMAADNAGLMSNEVVKLSADLGSFNNLPTARVMDDIQSALVGNYETMKKYGVVLNATVVQEKALAMGLGKTKDELTAADKAQAAYKLMVEGSAAAIGDMARTSEDYANQLKDLTAGYEDLRVELGQFLLPAMTELVGITREVVAQWTEVTGGETALTRQAKLAEDLYWAWEQYNSAVKQAKEHGLENTRAIENAKKHIDAASLALDRQAVFYKEVGDAQEETAKRAKELAEEVAEEERDKAEEAYDAIMAIYGKRAEAMKAVLEAEREERLAHYNEVMLDHAQKYGEINEQFVALQKEHAGFLIEASGDEIAIIKQRGQDEIDAIRERYATILEETRFNEAQIAEIKKMMAEEVAATQKGIDEKVAKEQKTHYSEQYKMLETMSGDTAQAMSQSFDSFFFDVLETRLESFADYINSFLKSVARALYGTVSGQAAESIIAGLGGLFGGGGAEAGGGAISPEELYPGVAHRGGVIGRDVFPTRYVPPEIFYNAPRLHGGLGMNEFPAILERGETVIPKDGRTQGVQITMNNFIQTMDSRSFDDFSRRNPGAFLRPYKEALIRGDRELRELMRAAR